MKRHGLQNVLAVLLFCCVIFACEQIPIPDPGVKSGYTPPEGLTGIEIRDRPDKIYYFKGEAFNADGLKVTGHFVYDLERDLTTSEYTLDPVDTSESGIKTVTVKSGNYNTFFEVDVDPFSSKLKSIELEKNPTKTDYEIGESFSTSGMKIKGIYSDNTKNTMNNVGIKISGYDKYARGTQQVRFMANDLATDPIAVTVKVPSTMKVEVTGNYMKGAYRSVYVKGEAFDLARSKLQAQIKKDSAIITTLSVGAGGISAEEDITLNYDPSKLGIQKQTLKLDDADSVDFELYVADVEPSVYFDYGYMRHAGNPNGYGPGGAGVYYAKPGETLVLSPVRFLVGYDRDNKDTGASYSWSVSEGTYTVKGKNDEFLSFTPASVGIYTVTAVVAGANYVTGIPITVQATANVVCYTDTLPAETFKLPLKNFAPGQFTESGNGFGWSLGTWGGYEVWQVEHKPSYWIDGNAFSGWEEPGIVWVMEDNNGNGLPDETWYELKGSDDFNSQYTNTITRHYSLTFFNRSTEDVKKTQYGQTIREQFWVDSKGRTGVFPGGWSGNFEPRTTSGESVSSWGVIGDWVTYTGTLLRDDGNIASTGDYSGLMNWWGYVDVNSSSVGGTRGDRKIDHFYIKDAVRADGTSIELKNVRFVKVQTGVFRYKGSLGEVSTEVYQFDELPNQADNFLKP